MRRQGFKVARVAAPHPRRADPLARFRRGELAAGLATAAVAGQLLLAPATLVVALALIVAGRGSRWRPHWLALPAVAGCGWLLAAGAGAVTGYVAEPRRLARAITGPAALPHLAAAVAATGRWLPGQLPLALLAGSAEAAAVLSLGWWRSGIAWRPGLVAALRRRAGVRALSAGHTVTRHGFALGVAGGSGMLAEVGWAEAEGGVLLAGPDERRLGQLGLAAAGAALRRRKTVLVLDLAGTAGPVAGLARSLGVPVTELSGAGKAEAAEAGQALTDVTDLGLAIRNRGAVVVAPGRPGQAGGAGSSQFAGELAGVLASLRELGLRADCLAWISGCEQVEPDVLAHLLSLGPVTGTAVVLSTCSRARAAILAPQVRVVIAGGPIPDDLALRLAERPPAGLSPSGRSAARFAAHLAAQGTGEFAILTPGRERGTGPARPPVLPGCLLVPVSQAVPALPAVPATGPGNSAPGGTGQARSGPGTTMPGRTEPGITVPGQAVPGQTRAAPALWPAVSPALPRGRIRADLVYLGWQQARPEPDPGPPPRPPRPAGPDAVNPGWIAAQRREQSRLSRPASFTASTSLALTVAIAAGWLAGFPETGLALASGLIAVAVAAVSGLRIWQGNRDLAGTLRAEQRRVARIREVQRQEQAGRDNQYALLHRDWQRRTAAYWRRRQWHPVTVPASVRRVDVAGGTLAGWSALLSTLALPRIWAGGGVTVLDLTEGGVAADLLAVARRLGTEPQVWVLPADLPRLTLGLDLGHAMLADVLALTVSAAKGPSAAPAGGNADGPGGGSATDAALIERVLDALGENATMAEIVAAFRALGQIGAPGQHLASALSAEQLARLSAMAGRGAERQVVDRAWAIEARLRYLGDLATSPAGQPQSGLRGSGLRIAWLDRDAATAGNVTVAAYLAAALTAVVRRTPPGPPWQQSIFLLGAERLPGDVLDRLCDGAETTGTGLVLCYRTIPAHVRERLGRGNAAVTFMRLGNAEDARHAAEQIGAEHKLLLSQLTETVGASVTDTGGDSYTSTVGTADSVAGSDSLTLTAGRSHGRARNGPGAAALLADGSGSASRDASRSMAISGSRTLTEGLTAGTSWGVSTARATGVSDSLARTVQRSREFLVEQHELQHLPPSALVLCYQGPGGRQVLLADVNPAIMTLPGATLAPAASSCGGSELTGAIATLRQ